MPDQQISPEIARLLQALWTQGYGRHRPIPTQAMPSGDDVMQVPHAPPFRPEPLVIGSPELARVVDQIVRAVPSIRGYVNTVQSGPNENVGSMLQGTRFRPEDFGTLNLLGVTHDTRGDIAINPRLEDSDQQFLPQVLLHEFTHAAGFPDEKVPEYAETLAPNAEAMHSDKPLTADQVSALIQAMRILSKK